MKAGDLDLRELLRFEPQGGVLQFAGQRALLFDAVALGILRRELIQLLGLSGARGVLTRFGYAHGWRTAEAPWGGRAAPRKTDPSPPSAGCRHAEAHAGAPTPWAGMVGVLHEGAPRPPLREKSGGSLPGRRAFPRTSRASSAPNSWSRTAAFRGSASVASCWPRGRA